MKITNRKNFVPLKGKKKNRTQNHSAREEAKEQRLQIHTAGERIIIIVIIVVISIFASRTIKWTFLQLVERQ